MKLYVRNSWVCWRNKMINEEKLLEIAKEILDNNEVKLDTKKEEIETWDSLAHVMLIASVAEGFGIDVPANQMSEITCLRDFLKYEK